MLQKKSKKKEKILPKKPKPNKIKPNQKPNQSKKKPQDCSSEEIIASIFLSAPPVWSLTDFMRLNTTMKVYPQYQTWREHLEFFA